MQTHAVELGQVWQDDPTKKVQAVNYTSGGGGGILMRYPDRLARIREGKSPWPIMAHVALTNECDLTCDTCCYAGRKFKEEISLPQLKKAVDTLVKVNCLGFELTGGGEPFMHDGVGEITKYALDAGLQLGVCTNGKRLEKIDFEDLKKFKYLRVGWYGPDEGYTYDFKLLDELKKSGVDVSGAYIWAGRTDTIINPNVVGGHDDVIRRLTARNHQTKDSFEEVLRLADEHQIPTRIGVDAIRPTHQVVEDYEYLKQYFKDREITPKFSFVSGDRFDVERPNDHCYMYMVKPFIYPWGTTGKGVIVDCPSTVLSPENGFRVQKRFVLCDIDGMEEFYTQGAKRRLNPCNYCNFNSYNKAIDVMVTEKKYDGFV